jgi:hypothetical protein
VKEGRWAMHMAQIAEKINVCKCLVGNPEGHSHLSRPGRRWKDNMKIDLKEIIWEGVDWIHLAQDMDELQFLVNMVENPTFLQNEGIFLSD